MSKPLLIVEIFFILFAILHESVVNVRAFIPLSSQSCTPASNLAATSSSQPWESVLSDAPLTSSTLKSLQSQLLSCISTDAPSIISSSVFLTPEECQSLTNIKSDLISVIRRDLVLYGGYNSASRKKYFICITRTTNDELSSVNSSDESLNKKGLEHFFSVLKIKFDSQQTMFRVSSSKVQEYLSSYFDIAREHVSDLYLVLILMSNEV